MDLPIPSLRQQPHGGWRGERDALARASGGALLFGVPLLFTMEMWWIGEVVSPQRLGAMLAAAFLINVVLARLGGFRDGERGWRGDVGEAVESIAVAVVFSAAILLALGRIDTGTPASAVIGVIGVQVVPLSLGATVANLVFSPDVGRASSGKQREHGTPMQELLNDVAATAAGALFIGFSIAPTGEVPMLAVSLGPVTSVAVLLLTMIAGYMIVFASGFDPSHRQRHVGGLFQRPISETVLATVIALAVAAGMLVVMGQIGAGDSLNGALAQILVLGVPAGIGGAAGRVVV